MPLSQTGAERLFEVLSQRYERTPTIVTSNLSLDEQTCVFGSACLSGALLDRLTHNGQIFKKTVFQITIALPMLSRDPRD